MSAASWARAREAAGVTAEQHEDGEDQKEEEVWAKFSRLSRRRARNAAMQSAANSEDKGLPAPLKALLERFQAGSMPKMTVPSVSSSEATLLRDNATAMGFFTDVEGTSLVLCKERPVPQKDQRTEPETAGRGVFSAKDLFRSIPGQKQSAVISSCEHCGMPFKSTSEILTHVQVCKGATDLLERSGRKKTESEKLAKKSAPDFSTICAKNEPEKIAEKPVHGFFEDSSDRRTVDDPFDVVAKKRKADPFDVGPPSSKASKGGSAKERQMAALARLEARRAGGTEARTQLRNTWTEQQNATAFSRPDLLTQEKADRQRLLRDDSALRKSEIPEFITGPDKSVPSIKQFNSGSAQRLGEKPKGGHTQDPDAEFDRPSKASKKVKDGIPGKLKFKETKRSDAESLVQNSSVEGERRPGSTSEKMEELINKLADKGPVRANASTPDKANSSGDTKPKKKALFAAYA